MHRYMYLCLRICVGVPVCGCDCVCGFGLCTDIHENGCCVQDVKMYACPPAGMSGYVCVRAHVLCVCRVCVYVCVLPVCVLSVCVCCVCLSWMLPAIYALDKEIKVKEDRGVVEAIVP